MTSGSDTTGPDGLGERLRDLDPADSPTDDECVERMYSNVRSECDKSDKSMVGYLRSRSTMARRMIVLAVFAILGVVGIYMFPMVDEALRNPQWIATLVAFVVLLCVAMMVVTRPVHRPELPRWQIACLVGIAVGATVLAAFWPGSGASAAATHQHNTGVMAGACMGFGVLLGVPVYALLRLVDRGNAFGSVVAAVAAGLAGNFILKAHCAIGTTDHVLLGHASVPILFVVGLGLVHWIIPSKSA